MVDPRVTLVVSTIGRPEQLDRLMSSLRELSDPSTVAVVLVDQTDSRESARYVDDATWPFPTTTTTSARGLSLGRNTGLTLVATPYVAFPDDDCWYERDTLDLAVRFLDRNSGVGGVSGVQLTDDGRPSMLRWAPDPCWIDRRNFYRTSISSTLFLRTELVREVGGFDVTLGAGSTQGYGSGEESDLVLRILESGARLRYEPRIIVRQDEPRDDLPGDFMAKMAGYGRGFGRLFADHHLPRYLLAGLLARKAVAAGVRTATGRRDLARADVAYLRGVLSGYRDRAR